MGTKRAPRPRNNGAWTESRYWQQVRTSLRRGFRYWKPAQAVKTKARRAYTGTQKNRKWEYQCANCKQWWRGTEVEIDHVIPAGSLKSNEDLVPFLENLTEEKLEGFQLLCMGCHKDKTTIERAKR